MGGLAALALGFWGLFVPIWPTAPFLLLAAWCFGRSSPRLHAWLRENRWFGAYLRDYQEGRGVPVWLKVGILLTLWASASVSLAVWVEPWWARVLVLLAVVGVSAHVLLLPVRRD